MNYYEILKVSKNASQQEIRDSYIKLIKQYHPDIYKGSKAFAEKTTKEINDAYDVLSVPERRREYDLSLEPPEPQYTPPDFNHSSYSGLHLLSLGFRAHRCSYQSQAAGVTVCLLWCGPLELNSRHQT